MTSFSVFWLSHPGPGWCGRPYGSSGEGNLEQQKLRREKWRGGPRQFHWDPDHPLHLWSHTTAFKIQQGGS